MTVSVNIDSLWNCNATLTVKSCHRSRALNVTKSLQRSHWKRLWMDPLTKWQCSVCWTSLRSKILLHLLSCFGLTEMARHPWPTDWSNYHSINELSHNTQHSVRCWLTYPFVDTRIQSNVCYILQRAASMLRAVYLCLINGTAPSNFACIIRCTPNVAASQK